MWLVFPSATKVLSSAATFIYWAAEAASCRLCRLVWCQSKGQKAKIKAELKQQNYILKKGEIRSIISTVSALYPKGSIPNRFMLTGFRIFSPFLIQWHFLFKLERKINLRHFPTFFSYSFFRKASYFLASGWENVTSPAWWKSNNSPTTI